MVSEREGMPVGVHAFDVLATEGGSVLIWSRPHGAILAGSMSLMLRACERSWRPNAFLEDRAIAKPERLTMTRPDELVVEGWLLDPPGRDPLATDGVPMVVEIHGGPSAMWGPGERTMWHEFQWLAGLGYAVTANPVVRAGMAAFQAANQKNLGSGQR